MSSRIAVSDRAVDRGLLAVSVLMLAMLHVSADTETDAFWMAREGADVLAGGGWIHPDRWGWQPVPGSFVPTSPLWEALLGAAWSAAGIVGLELVGVLAGCITLGVVAWLSLRLGATPLIVVPFLCVLAAVDPGPLSNRAFGPAFALFLALSGWFWVNRWVLTGSLAGAMRGVLVVGVGSFAGIWLHASWTLWGPVLVATVVVLVANTRGSATRLRFVLAIGSALAIGMGVASGPERLSAWSEALRVAQVSRGLNSEWMGPLEAGQRWTIVWVFAVAVAVVALVAAWARHDANAPLARWLALGALAGCAAAGVGMRFAEWSLVAAVPVLASATSFAAAELASRRRSERFHAPYWRRIIAGGLLILVPFAATTMPQAYPSMRDPAIGALPRGCHLVANDPAASLVVRPDVRIWFDGRIDYWGTARIRKFIALMGTHVPTQLPRGTTCVLLRALDGPQAASGLRTMLRASSGWSRVPLHGSASELWVMRQSSPAVGR